MRSDADFRKLSGNSKAVLIAKLQKLQFLLQNKKSIIIIQKSVRRHVHQTMLGLHGPAFYNRDICKNELDVCTFEPIRNIPSKYLISYRDTYGSVYGFHIHTYVKNMHEKIP